MSAPDGRADSSPSSGTPPPRRPSPSRGRVRMVGVWPKRLALSPRPAGQRGYWSCLARFASPLLVRPIARLGAFGFLHLPGFLAFSLVAHDAPPVLIDDIECMSR